MLCLLQGAAMSRTILVTIIAVYCVTMTVAATTTDGKYCPSEYCVSLRQCPALLSLLRSRRPQQLHVLKQSVCGYLGKEAKVCCAKPFVTAPVVTSTEKIVSSAAEGSLSMPPSSGALPARCGVTIRQHYTRIYGGRPAAIASQPWIAALMYNNKSERAEALQCSGALINNRYVVTAAHCLDPRETEDRKLSSVVLGEWRQSTNPDCSSGSCSDPVLTFGVEEIILHPHFNRGYRYNNDIALLRLKNTVPYSLFVQPVCLPPSRLEPSDVAIGSPVEVSGWGATRTRQSSDVLNLVTLNIANPFLCKNIFKHHFNVNGGQICIGGVDGQDTCKGDSGSPVVKKSSAGKYYLLAITSYGGSRCGRENYPAVYTSVPHYVSWIQRNLRT